MNDDKGNAKTLAFEQVDLREGKNARLYMERPLPFLVLYRTPADGIDRYTRLLGMTEASYFSTGDLDAARIRSILQEYIMPLSERFGGFLLLEIGIAEGTQEQDFLLEYQEAEPLPIVAHFKEKLAKITVSGRGFTVGVRQVSDIAPQGLAPLDLARLEGGSELVHLGLFIQPSWVAENELGYYPVYLRELRTKLSIAFKESFFEFIRLETSVTAAHFQVLGRTRIDPLVYQMDEALAELNDQFQLLQLVTPTNIEAAWQEFREADFSINPVFHYHHLPVDPEKVKRELFQLPLDQVADPTFAYLLRDKRDEIAKMVNMLADRERRDFVYHSQLLFGHVDDKTVAIAKALLTAIPIPRHARSTDNHYDTNDEEQDRPRLDAAQFHQLALNEIDRLATQCPSMKGQVELVEGKGLRVMSGVLQIGKGLNIEASRAEALLQHEIGTHMVTYYNGKAQPFQIFSSGVPGYEQLQEGLAVLAEYLVGGLSNGRLRTLAARVIAVDSMVKGFDFRDTFKLLTKKYFFTPYTAYTITMRVFRGGGFTKDAVYLKGLICILEHLKQGNELQPLLVGKIRQDYLGIVREMQHRSVLQPPLIQPGFLDEKYADRLKAVKDELTIFKMIN